MLSQKKIQEIIGIVLLIGTLLSAVLVVIGGVLYLIQYGQQTIETELQPLTPTVTSIKQIWEFSFSLVPLGIVELGLLLLVATQTLRVALLCCFYLIIKDYKFTLVSTFILLILIYSSFWRS